MKIFKYLLLFFVLAGVGVLLGCWIHGMRTNQPTLMSGVAFVRELPYGEKIVGYIETTVFSYQEEKNLIEYKEKHKDIKIDPEVLKKHQQLYKEGSSK